MNKESNKCCEKCADFGTTIPEFTCLPNDKSCPCHQSNDLSAGWEEGFAEECGLCDLQYQSEFEKVKSFIRNLLQAEREKLIEKIEGMRKSQEPKDHPFPETRKDVHRAVGYNQAITDILNKIKE